MTRMRCRGRLLALTVGGRFEVALWLCAVSNAAGPRALKESHDVTARSKDWPGVTEEATSTEAAT